MTFNLRLFILMFRSECADFSFYIYLSVYLIHGDKQQKSEHGIEARFYEIERNYRGNEHFDDRLNTGAHEDSGKDEVERYHDEGHQHRADRESRRHAFFAADFFVHQTGRQNEHARRAEVHEKADNVARRADGKRLNSRGDEQDHEPRGRSEQHRADEHWNIRNVVFEKRRGGQKRKLDEIHRHHGNRREHRHDRYFPQVLS